MSPKREGNLQDLADLAAWWASTTYRRKAWYVFLAWIAASAAWDALKWVVTSVIG